MCVCVCSLSYTFAKTFVIVAVVVFSLLCNFLRVLCVCYIQKLDEQLLRDHGGDPSTAGWSGCGTWECTCEGFAYTHGLFDYEVFHKSDDMRERNQAAWYEAYNCRSLIL